MPNIVEFFRARLERARGQEDRGASAIEWIVIGAITVGLVIAVAVAISSALSDKASEIEDCINNVDYTSDTCNGAGT